MIIPSKYDLMGMMLMLTVHVQIHDGFRFTKRVATRLQFESTWSNAYPRREARGGAGP